MSAARQQRPKRASLVAANERRSYSFSEDPMSRLHRPMTPVIRLALIGLALVLASCTTPPSSPAPGGAASAGGSPAAPSAASTQNLEQSPAASPGVADTPSAQGTGTALPSQAEQAQPLTGGVVVTSTEDVTSPRTHL